MALDLVPATEFALMKLSMGYREALDAFIARHGHIPIDLTDQDLSEARDLPGLSARARQVLDLHAP